MPNRQKCTKSDVLAAIPKSGGIVSAIAVRLNIDRRTLYNYRKKWSAVDAAIADAVEEGLDMAESRLLELIKEKDIRAIMFYLERKGRDRGWGAQPQIQLQGSPVQPVICFDSSSHVGEDFADDAESKQ